MGDWSSEVIRRPTGSSGCKNSGSPRPRASCPTVLASWCESIRRSRSIGGRKFRDRCVVGGRAPDRPDTVSAGGRTATGGCWIATRRTTPRQPELHATGLGTGSARKPLRQLFAAGEPRAIFAHLSSAMGESGLDALPRNVPNYTPANPRSTSRFTASMSRPFSSSLGVSRIMG